MPSAIGRAAAPTPATADGSSPARAIVWLPEGLVPAPGFVLLTVDLGAKRAPAATTGAASEDRYWPEGAKDPDPMGGLPLGTLGIVAAVVVVDTGGAATTGGTSPF